MRRDVIGAIGVAVLAVGCGVTAPIPQTAEEYRQGILKDGFGTLYETYEVNQPYAKVVATLKAKSKECLDAKQSSMRCISGSCKTYVDVFTPTIVSSANRTELHLQLRREPDDALYLGDTRPPAVGAYLLVADATPVGNGNTKMNVYSTKHVYTNIAPAIKRWASASNMGCPSLARTNQ